MMSGWRHYLFYFFTSITIFYHTKLFQRFPRPHGLLCFRSRSFYSPAHRLFFPLLSLSRFPSLSSFQFGFRESFRPPFVQRKLYSFLFIIFIIISLVLLLLKNTTEDAFALKFSFLFLSLSLLFLLLSGGGQDTNVSQEREESDDNKGCRWCRETPTFGGPRKRISADGGGSSHVGIARGSKSFGRRKRNSSSSSSSTIVVYIVVYRRINTFPSSSRNTCEQ